MRLRFTKCHGSGNDFPLVDARALTLSDAEWAAAARALADRAGPVGGDGLLLLVEGDGDCAFGMRMFNADGSEAETCLNGLRCVARAGFEATGLDRARVRLRTSEAEVARDAELAPGVYTVEERAGPAGLDVRDWPMRSGVERIVDAVVPPLSDMLRFTAVAMPNPHLVCFVDRVDEAELVRVGLVCEAAPDWLPNRANVSFVEVRPGGLFVRTHERGVGLTDACGSAMAASAVAAGLTGRIPFGTRFTVWNRGGPVRARADADLRVTLSGNATFEWEGEFDLEMGEFQVLRRFDDEVAAWNAAAREPLVTS
ncbi:diaminopimelate epimerase [Sphingomonas lenta]|uniref:Diaminopimelate epimerase n=1 Tax=Sphingomonas lenta TaxID=1141887 RepID=A0A2A2SEF7_9SPHN|nr:diaminopimelate epimerase [Sphingomonas lenta]PAX07684.1 diaminopimelate epimerase [Sphingomonas lenta]